MKLRTKADIFQVIYKDKNMMKTLQAVESLQLPDSWICAGWLRSKIWDIQHGYHIQTKSPDIDVIYFDNDQMSEATEKELEKKLHDIMPELPWSVKNQARMHLTNQVPAYLHSIDAISKFPETATAIAIRITKEGALEIAAPHGITDVCEGIIRPTPFFQQSTKRMKIYEKRVREKNWQSRWPNLMYA